MKILLRYALPVLLLFCLGISPALRADVPLARSGHFDDQQGQHRFFRPPPVPVPAPVQIDLTNQSAETFIQQMVFGLPVQTNDPRLKGDGDPYQAEVDDVYAVAAGKYGDPTQIHIAYDRYEFTLKAAKALVAAKKAGAHVSVNTYLANSLQYPKGASDNVDNFSQLQFKDNEQGQALKYLLDNGFNYNGHEYGISSPPFAPNAPLMHEKATVIYKGELPQTPASVLADEGQTAHWLQQSLVGNDVQILSMWIGTNNHTDDRSDPNNHTYRVNRTVHTTNQVMGRYLLWHLGNLAATYRQGKLTSDMPVEPPVQLNFANGEFVWLAGTNGTRDLNQVRRDILDSTYDQVDPNTKQVTQTRTHKLIENFGSESVDTDARTYASEEKALEGNPAAIDFHLQDQAFARDDNFSVFDGRLGKIVVRPFEGKRNVVYPFKPQVLRQEQTWVWRRLAPGQILHNRDGNPIGVWLLHDKTEVTDRVELNQSGNEGQEVTDITMGSENGSGNFPSAELRLWFHVARSSGTAQMFRDSIQTPVKLLPQYFMPGTDFILADELAYLVGHTVYEIPRDIDQQDSSKRLPTLEQIRDALKAGQYDSVRSMLLRIGSMPTMLDQKLDPSVMNQRLNSLVASLKWYQSLPAAQKPYADNGVMPIIKVTELAEVLNNKLYPDQVEAKLDNILYSKDLKNSGQLSHLVDGLAKAANIPTADLQDDDNDGGGGDRPSYSNNRNQQPRNQPRNPRSSDGGAGEQCEIPMSRI